MKVFFFTNKGPVFVKTNNFSFSFLLSVKNTLLGVSPLADMEINSQFCDWLTSSHHTYALLQPVVCFDNQMVIIVIGPNMFEFELEEEETVQSQ